MPPDFIPLLPQPLLPFGVTLAVFILSPNSAKVLHLRFKQDSEFVYKSRQGTSRVGTAGEAKDGDFVMGLIVVYQEGVGFADV